MEKILAAVVLSVAGCVAFSLVMIGARKAEIRMDANDFIVRRPKMSVVFYIAVTAFCLGLLAVFGFSAEFKDDGEPIFEIYYIFVPSLLLGVLCIVMWFRWKIVIKGDLIRFTSYFGKEKSFTFGYITAVRRGVFDVNGEDMNCITAYHGKKALFSLASDCRGFNVLASRLESEGVPVIGMKDKIVG